MVRQSPDRGILSRPLSGLCFSQSLVAAGECKDKIYGCKFTAKSAIGQILGRKIAKKEQIKVV
jgi:hypothetical protein